MGKKLFRHNEQELGSSPDQLQDYIRVTNPFVWVVLIAVMLLLAGGIVAAIFGKVEITLNASAYVESGVAYIDLATPNAFKIKEGMTVRFTGQETEGTIEKIKWLSDDLAEASFTVDLPDALVYPYPCVVVTDLVSPISFLIN